MKEEAPRQDLFEKIGLAPLEGVGMAVRKGMGYFNAGNGCFRGYKCGA